MSGSKIAIVVGVVVVAFHPSLHLARSDGSTLVQTGASPGHGVFSAVRCDGRLATIVGTNEHDILRGTDGPDVIVAGAGGDWVDAGAGDDVVCGGPGRDTILGETGDDRLFGQADVVKGGGGALPGVYGDRLDGGEGDDVISGGWDPRQNDPDYPGYGKSDSLGFFPGSSESPVTVDLVEGHAEGDLIGSDRIVTELRLDVQTGPGDDRIIGTSGANVLDAGSGSDTVFAGGGGDLVLLDPEYPDPSDRQSHDRVDLGPGDDFASSSAGSDRMRGNAGDDELVASAIDIGTRGLVPSMWGGPGDDQLSSIVARGGVTNGGPGRDSWSIGEHQARATTPRLSIDVPHGEATRSSVPNPQTQHFSSIEEFAANLEFVAVTFLGSDASESLSAEGRLVAARMGGGDDVVTGSPSDDVVAGGSGHDAVDARDGIDQCRQFEVVENCEAS